MGEKQCRIFVGDFETTVYENQDFTEVWASACVELHSENVQVFHSLSEQFEYLLSLKSNVVIYYHNLKFDGSFWLDFLINRTEYKQAYTRVGEDVGTTVWYDNKDMPRKSFKYSISDKGQWYTITIKTPDRHFIEIRDSLKLLPFSVKRIGESFGTKHKKLDMEYAGFRYAGCIITDEELEYIKNDVLVVKEALEIMYGDGHNKLTIGACCLNEFKKTYDETDYANFFPDLTVIPLDEKKHRYSTVDAWLRKSYRGGWCYVVKGKECSIKHNGTTADVNSLYPSMMSSESGNRYPIGLPTFWFGNMIPDEAIADNKFFFVRIRTRFYLKPNKLPFIQIKGNHLYKGTECLETSDIYNKVDGKYYRSYTDSLGNEYNSTVELTLTQTDFQLLQEHYYLEDFEIIDGCWFWTEIGIFDKYISTYAKIKMESTGAKRESAKLFLNNLYGKMASSTDSSFKVAFPKDGAIGFMTVPANDKKAGFIAVGSAITSYSRNFTIRAAQKNYHGVNERGFIYADTDSIHCDISPKEFTGIDIDDVKFCHWKLESTWDEAIFTRQKTYIEHVVGESKKGQIISVEPYYLVKCAGMPQKSKNMFITSLHGAKEEDYETYTDEEKEFLYNKEKEPIKRTIEDFKIGLKVPDKLMPKRIKGGIVLVNTTYEMR